MLINDENEKIIYQIIGQKDGKVELKGLNFRKKITVEFSKVEKISEKIYENEEMRNNLYLNEFLFRKRGKKCLLGTVLHFDSDAEYLQRCVDFYKKMGIYCYPVFCDTENVSDFLEKVEINFVPDVIVITGHDYYNGDGKKEIKNYSNSKYFVKAISAARIKYATSVIIAGACQSHFEALLASGANFASSPKRVNVHVYDPAIIAVNICTTSIRNVVNYDKIEKYIVKLKDSYGGIETYGKMKMLY